MVHFEFGRVQLAEPHPLNTFELAHRARVLSSYFQRSWSGSLGPFCKIIPFFVRAAVAKPRQPLCSLVLSDTIFRIFESTAVARSGVLALLLWLPLVNFSRRLGQFGIR